MTNNGSKQQESSTSGSEDHAGHTERELAMPGQAGSGHVHPGPTGEKPGRALLLLILYFFIGMFVGQFAGVLLAMLLFDLGYQQIVQISGDLMNEPNGRYVLYCLQFGSAVGAFIAAPLFYLRRFENHSFSVFFNKESRYLIPIGLTIAITLSFMMVNSILIEWNANLTFPEGWERIEKMLQEQEEQMHQLTEYLTTFESVQDFMLAFVIIAIIPAIGEELLFRGLIQTKMAGVFRNPHVAIWLTALLFATIHFQFYGLVPRLFLGAIFGYLYYWSGSLLLPILAHFVNNGFSLLMYFLYQRDLVDFDVSETAALSNSYIIVFLLLGVACFWAYRRFFQGKFMAADE